VLVEGIYTNATAAANGSLESCNSSISALESILTGSSAGTGSCQWLAWQMAFSVSSSRVSAVPQSFSPELTIPALTFQLVSVVEGAPPLQKQCQRVLRSRERVVVLAVVALHLRCSTPGLELSF
jgi:hypothetical protein